MQKKPQFKIILLISFLLINFTQVLSQSTSSFLSYYNFGVSNFEGNASQIGLGNTGVSNINPYSYNMKNYSSSSFLKNTNFGVSANYNGINSTINGVSGVKNYSGNLTNAFLAFPIAENFGFGVSYNQLYSSKYTIKNVFDEDNTNIFTRTGGINSFNVNGSYKYAFDEKNTLSIGFNYQYIFGNITQSLSYNLAKLENNTIKEKKQIYSGASRMGVGALLYHTLSESDYLSIGVNVDFKKNIQPNLFESFSSVNRQSSIVNNSKTDSLYDITAEVPLNLMIGFDYVLSDTWFFSTEYQYKSATINEIEINETVSHKIGAGVGWLPRRRSVNNYLESMKYNLGSYLKTGGVSYIDPVTNDNFPIMSYGVTGGIEFPFPRSPFSKIDLSFVYGKNTFNGSNILSEQFFIASLSLSFSELWFLEQTYD